MKVFHEVETDSARMTAEDKEKVALLKLTDSGKYMKGIGIRDGQFYVIAESDTDDIYLNYKAYMLTVRDAFSKKDRPDIDPRIVHAKEMEYVTKHNQAFSRFLEIPS